MAAGAQPSNVTAAAMAAPGGSAAAGSGATALRPAVTPYASVVDNANREMQDITSLAAWALDPVVARFKPPPDSVRRMQAADLAKNTGAQPTIGGPVHTHARDIHSRPQGPPQRPSAASAASLPAPPAAQRLPLATTVKALTKAGKRPAAAPPTDEDRVIAKRSRRSPAATWWRTDFQEHDRWGPRYWSDYLQCWVYVNVYEDGFDSEYVYVQDLSDVHFNRYIQLMSSRWSYPLGRADFSDHHTIIISWFRDDERVWEDIFYDPAYYRREQGSSFLLR